MARISLAGHWKFRRFVRALTALPPAPDQLTGAVPVARGILELLWEAGYAAVSDYVGRPAEIAEIVQWTGDPAVLVTLLVDAGFLDVHAPGEYRIHDLWTNAPRYAQQRWVQKYPGQDPPWRPAALSAALNAEQSAAYPVQSSPVQGERKSSAAGAARSLDWNDDVLVPLGYELVRQGKRFETDADLKEALKDLAVRYGIAFDAESIARALDALKHARAPLFVLPPPKIARPS